MNLNDLVEFREEQEIEKIAKKTVELLRNNLHKRGLIVAVSGGVDSAVCAALAASAVGKKKVYCILLPEHDSSSASVELGKSVVENIGLEYEIQNIGKTLEEIGCYSWRDKAIKNVFPEYDGTWKNKIIIKGGSEGKLNHFSLVVEKPGGEIVEERLSLNDYLQIVAATNYKQRIRKNIEYFHADRLNYAVVGTPNRLEYDQGFFVKNGDGAADIKPIAHLYKTQVYALASYFGLPESVCNAAPTTDTYSLTQGQDEFYFSLPYQQMDVALWAYNNKLEPSKLAEYIGVSVERAEYVYKDIEAKRRATVYQHLKPQLIDEIFNQA